MSMNSNGANSNILNPYIPAEQKLPEITLKAFILGVILAVVMGAANAYLGLKVGLTVSATIPAAVMSMAILKFFSKSNILENNIVQTTASAGETVAAACVFTLPALIMMGSWDCFPLGISTAIILVGGLLGVLFSIPLRRAFIVESQDLKFPEGIATGEILKAGDKKIKGGARELLAGGLLSAAFKFGQSGFMVLSESAQYWFHGARTVFGFGTGLSLVLTGAGYIVGIQVGASMLVGALLAWVIGVPVIGMVQGLPEGASAYDAAVTIWSKNIRLIGVGVMVVGGIWTIITLIKPLFMAVKQSIRVLSDSKLSGAKKILRTECDIPIHYVIMGILLLSVPLAFIYSYVISSSSLVLSCALHWQVVIGLTIFSLIVGFLCAAIAGYMTGLVGASNNPLSGITIMAVLSVSALILAMLKNKVDFDATVVNGLAAAAIAIIVGAVMANAGAISGDNLQDLKSGQIVGATPWKQQVMLMVGVVAAAAVMAPIMQVLFKAYGIGDIMPREGMDPTQALGAPKAALMAAIAKGVFTNTLDWQMFSIGGVIAVVCIAIDTALIKSNSKWRLPTLAVALGIYMPLDITVPLFIGGVIASLADSKMLRNKGRFLPSSFEEKKEHAKTKGMLFASGLIAGESLIGIVLSIPFAAYQSTDVFKISLVGFESVGMMLSSMIFLAVCFYMLRIGSTLGKQES